MVVPMDSLEAKFLMAVEMLVLIKAVHCQIWPILRYDNLETVENSYFLFAQIGLIK